MILLSGVAILALTIASAPSALAQTVTLQCDPIITGLMPPVVVTIDETQRTVHFGDSDKAWWRNQHVSIDDSDGPSHPQETDSDGMEVRPYTHCSMQMTEYVRITSDKIEFGTDSVQLKPCGFDAERLTGEFLVTNSIDRLTGILSVSSEQTFNGEGLPAPPVPTFHCSLFKGPLF